MKIHTFFILENLLATLQNMNTFKIVIKGFCIYFSKTICVTLTDTLKAYFWCRNMLLYTRDLEKVILSILDLHLCYFNECFSWMFLSSVKEISYWKKINRLLCKGLPNIYLKVTIEKNWYSQNFDFLGFKIRLLVSFCGALEVWE